MAYKNKNEAIQTYQDVKKQFLINDFNGESVVEFENQNDAISYYENVVRTQIENGIETNKYNVAGTDMTKEQVVQWIGQTSSTKYQHGDYSWTSTNIPNTEDLELTVDDDNKIQPFTPINNAYWLNFDSTGLSGTLSGPQYIETNDDEATLKSKLYNGWKSVESKPMNILLSGLMANSAIISANLNMNNQLETRDWTLDKLFLDSDATNDFEGSFWKLYGEELLDNDSFDYIKIKDSLSNVSNLPLFEKNLIFVKNLYFWIITRNNSGNEEKVVELINKLKKAIKELIKKETSTLYSELVDALFIDETTDTFTNSSEVLNLSDLIDLFLNPSKFQYISMSKLNKRNDIIQAIQSIGDVVFGDFGQLQGLISDISESLDTINESAEKIKELNKKILIRDIENNENLTKSEKMFKISEIDQAISESSVVKDSGKLEVDVKFAKVKSFMAGYEIAKSIWEIGNMVSFLTYKTYENDLGNGQVLTYKVIGFRIPILGIEFDNEAFKKHITAFQLIDSAIIPKPQNEGDNYYVVFGSLFTNREDAETYLKSYIINNPLKFKDTKAFFTNIMSQQDEQEVIFDPENENPIPDVKSYPEQFQEFILKIFNKYFADNSVKAYSDGFGNFYSNKADALINMSQNITNKNFNTKYKITHENFNYYYDTFDEAWSMQQIFIRRDLQHKAILNTDLIKTTVFNELEEHRGLKYSIFKIYFDGKYRYFATYDDALHYMVGNSNIKRINDSSSYFEISFKGQLFNSEAAFYKWVAENTKVMKGSVN